MEAKDVGRNVKQLMEKHNLTAKVLAEHIGISTKTLARKLDGKQEFYISEIIAITEIFNLSINQSAEVFFANSKENSEDKEKIV